MKTYAIVTPEDMQQAIADIQQLKKEKEELEKVIAQAVIHLKSYWLFAKAMEIEDMRAKAIK